MIEKIRIKPRVFRNLIAKEGPVVVIGAHDPLSARLVEKNGFSAIWASGLGISTIRVVPDRGILSRQTMLNEAKRINEKVSLPVIADCDTGFGGPEEVAKTVRLYERAGIAGISVEDQKHPKRNSLLYNGQKLCSTEEFVEKILAAKEAKQNPDFMFIARVEALVAGKGIEEALARARKYAEAGADAIFIHSNSVSPDEVIQFSTIWRKESSIPLVCSPTTFFETPIDYLYERGLKVFIYANQILRGSIRAIEETLKLLKEGKLSSISVLLSPLLTIREIVEPPPSSKVRSTLEVEGEKKIVNSINKILIYDDISSKAIERLQAIFGKENVILGKEMTEDEAIEILDNVSIIVVRSKKEISKKLLKAAKDLISIVRAGVGIDNIALDEANELGILVQNEPRGNVISTAEHTIWFIMNFFNKPEKITRADKNDVILHRSMLHGKKLGLIGFGNVGKHVAKLATAFGMEVSAYSRTLSKTLGPIGMNIYSKPISKLLEESDIISLHLSSDPETKDFLDAEKFEQMKKKPLVVLTSRAFHVNEWALIEALRSGKISGFCTDFRKNHSEELLSLPNVIAVDHGGAQTPEAQDIIGENIVEIIENLRKGRIMNLKNNPLNSRAKIVEIV